MVRMMALWIFLVVMVDVMKGPFGCRENGSRKRK